VVIMAGGIGSRFWPYSRTNKPKQFLDVLGIGKSLLQMTYDRFAGSVPNENIYVVTNSSYKKLVQDQLPDLSDEQILGEPLRRNTAPCIAYASHKIHKKNKEAIITVAPSDHLILEVDSFKNTLKKALKSAEDQKKLITIGLKPNRPETGFGYIQYIESDAAIKAVKTFTEKPERELAEKFIESGDFVWNSGIFIWGVQAILNAFDKNLSEVSEIFGECEKYLSTKDEAEAIATAYAQSPNVSIDFGIMEKSQNVFTVLADFGWSDLGSWNSLHEYLDHDKNGNAANKNTLLYDTKDTLIHTENEKLVVVQGLKNYLVADCDGVLLICDKSDEQKFRNFVADVKEKKGKKYL